MTADEEIEALMEAEPPPTRVPRLTAKEFMFDVDEEESAELDKDNQKQWTIMQGVLAKRGAYDLDLYDGKIMFALSIEHEYLLDELVHGIIEQLDEITGRRIKASDAWGMF